MTTRVHSVRRGSGPPLLLVHGMGSASGTWSTILDRLAEQRSVIAIDLPGFGESAPLLGAVTSESLADSVAEFIAEEGLDGIDTVGSSMGARLVLELARRGVGGNAVALDPGGFWTPGQKRIFAMTVGPSLTLVPKVKALLPALTGNAVTRSLFFGQLSARPWALPGEIVLAEMHRFIEAKSLGAAFRDMVDGPLQAGAPAGTTPGRVTIGWGRKDKITFPSQAKLATERFPDATLHWFDKSGHYPHWDQPEQTADLILASTG